jgi:DNA-binding NarL/FixJ family response regulator
MADITSDEKTFAILNARGLTVEEIAAETHQPPKAVRNAFDRLQRRTRARNRTQLVMLANAQGLYSAAEVLEGLERDESGES